MPVVTGICDFSCLAFHRFRQTLADQRHPSHMKNSAVQTFERVFMARIVMDADGACSGNPGPGGWACLLRIDDRQVMLQGGSPHSTNNVMELRAVAAGLAWIRDNAGNGPFDLEMRLDAEYVLKGLRDWRANWKARGWRKSSGERVKNAEIWQDLDGLMEALGKAGTIRFTQVRGHSGDPGNEAADAAAVAARDASRNRMTDWADPPAEIGPAVTLSPADPAGELVRDALERGWIRYRDVMHDGKTGYLGSLQKRVEDECGTRYFVNLDIWDMGSVTRGMTPGLAVEAHAQFREAGPDGTWVNLRRPHADLAETEAFFDRVWTTMGFGMYERTGATQEPGGP